MNATGTARLHDGIGRGVRGWAAYGAAAWGLLFAAVHVYWVLGGRWGLPAGMDLFSNTALLVIDIIAVPVSLGATALALSLVNAWGRWVPARLRALGAWGAAALMTVHALPTVPDWAALATGTRTTGDFTGNERFVTFLYEPWFMAGGVLFGLAAFGFHRARR
ncbi:DUF3995 domain-containing protein [Actinomadura namibiensis]|uniref:DUF3995 domain-containing protein n=1 Tax=Actinomadura namibiensis TaxID=182080 RepID=A0A7W3LM46_ACTNM|nr:DUF3995 domain-containing protein [Actinomadura namibiensis]MBA8950550.1 hypothetical protein [Actinomadura namibiensis]